MVRFSVGSRYCQAAMVFGSFPIQESMQTMGETGLPVFPRPRAEGKWQLLTPRQIGGLLSHFDNVDGQSVGCIGPIVFSAANARFIANFPNDPAEVWSADITARRNGGDTNVFESILFVETDVTASIYGAECKDGRPDFLRDDLATRQQQFIAFLRKETASDNTTLAQMRTIFTGHEYSSELKATGAYLEARRSDLEIGVGYLNSEGDYILLAVAAADY